MVQNVWDMVPAVAPGDCSVVFASPLKKNKFSKKHLKESFSNFNLPLTLYVVAKLSL